MSARTWAAVREYLDLNRQQFPLVVIPIAVLGIPALFRRDAKAGWLLLLGYLTVLFAAVRFLAATGEDGTSFIPCQLITAIWFGVGAGVLLAWAASASAFSTVVAGRGDRLFVCDPALRRPVPLAPSGARAPAAGCCRAAGPAAGVRRRDRR